MSTASDLGYGLGQIGKGISGGLVRGQMYRQEQEKEAKATEAKDKQQKFQNSIVAFQQSLSAANSAPSEERQAVFNSTYKSLNPEGEIPKVSFKGDEVEWRTITGPKGGVVNVPKAESEQFDMVLKAAIEKGVPPEEIFKIMTSFEGAMIQKYPQVKESKDSEFERLLNSLNLTEEQKEAYRKSYLEKKSIPTGMSLEVGPEGGISFYSGQQPGGEIDQTRSVQTQVQKDLLKATNGLARQIAVAKQFDPKYQQLGVRWSVMATNWREKLTDWEPSEKEKQELIDFSAFRRRAISNLNQYIKEITGAAMSVEEAKRLTKALPDPGTGFFDGDGPTMFKAKLDDAIKELRMAVARYHFIATKGISIEDISLEKMPDIMNRRGLKLMEEFKIQNPEVDEIQIKNLVMNKLAEEFGLVM